MTTTFPESLDAAVNAAQDAARASYANKPQVADLAAQAAAAQAAAESASSSASAAASDAASSASSAASSAALVGAPAGSAIDAYIGSGASVAVRKDTAFMLASEHGVAGDNTTDDAAALNSLLSSAATFGLGVKLAALTTVKVVASTITVPSGTRLDLNGSTIRNARTGSSDRLLTLSIVSNVTIENGTIDGDKASYAGVTEQRHNIHIVGSSSVTLRNIVSKNAKGDGIYVGDQLGLSSDIHIEDVTCTGNHRQGMSISHVSGLTAVGCWFINTSGTSPQSGVDIEPNVDGVACNDIAFTNCFFSGNAAYGLVISTRANPTARQDSFDFIGCHFDSNLSGGMLLSCARRVAFIGGSINDNTGRGVWISTSSGSTADDVEFNGVRIFRNTLSGVRADTAFNGLTFIGCHVMDNSQAVPGAQMGIDLLPASSSVGVRVIGCRMGGSTQSRGLRINANTSGVVLVGNSYPGNASGSTSLSDDATQRVRADDSGMDIPTTSAFNAKMVGTSSSGSTLWGLRATGDTVDRLAARTDGVLTFSSGSASQDTQLSRVAANVLGVGADDCIRTGKNVTASRPGAATVGQGSQFFDTTLNKPIWSDGTNWRDATGTAV